INLPAAFTILMADKQNVKESEVDKNLALQRILLEQEKERTKQAEQRAIIERTKQAEQLAIIEVAKTEQLRLEKQKRDDDDKKERSKLMKIDDGQLISISTSAVKLLIHDEGYYDTFVAPYLHQLDIVSFLNDNNINVTNDMINVFAKHFYPLRSCGKIAEDAVQCIHH
ncbi:unnamed protein product, partial [Rotaria magnacalcarata]